MSSARVALILLLGLCGVSLVSCDDRNTTETANGLNEPDFETPEYVLPCSKKDPKLDACFHGTLMHIRPYLVKGIPELDVPSIEPLVIPEVKMENGQGPVRVTAYFGNVTVVGLGNYTIHKVRTNISAYRFDIQVSMPKLELQGKYDINGNVLLFPIQSKGDFWAVFGDVNVIIRLQGVEEIKNGVRYMTIARVLLNFELNRARFRIMDEQNGDNVIGQALNQFLNQNAKEIIEEMKPAANLSISKVLKTFLNKAFGKLPFKVWMHDT